MTSNKQYLCSEEWARTETSTEKVWWQVTSSLRSCRKSAAATCSAINPKPFLPARNTPAQVIVLVYQAAVTRTSEKEEILLESWGFHCLPLRWWEDSLSSVNLVWGQGEAVLQSLWGNSRPEEGWLENLLRYSGKEGKRRSCTAGVGIGSPCSNSCAMFIAATHFWPKLLAGGLSCSTKHWTTWELWPRTWVGDPCTMEGKKRIHRNTPGMQIIES